jgi:hypothetical protein
MLKKNFILPSLLIILLSGPFFTSCNSNEQFADTPAENSLSAKPSELQIITDSLLQKDTVVVWNSFKEAALIKIKDTEKRIEDAQSDISIGIGPVHDQQFKSITEIEYKTDGLKKSLSEFSNTSMDNKKSFMRSFNTGILQVNRSLDTLTLE